MFKNVKYIFKCASMCKFCTKLLISIILSTDSEEEPPPKRMGPYSTFQMSNERTPVSNNGRSTPASNSGRGTPASNVQNALTPVHNAHQDILTTLDAVCREVNEFCKLVRSELWKESRRSFNTVHEDTTHNYKRIHFEVALAEMLLEEEKISSPTKAASLMSTMMRFVTNLQNLAFSLQPESTPAGSTRHIVHLLMHTTWILSRTLRERLYEPFYIDYYLLINCVYRYTSTPRLGKSGEGRRFFFKTRYL